MTNQSYALERHFAEAYAALPETARARIESSLGGPPAVFASFRTPPGAWPRAIPSILKVLLEHAGQLVHAEEIPVWRIPTLEDVVLERCSAHSAGRAGSMRWK